MLDYDRSLSENFESTAELHPDHLAYQDHSISSTYEELNRSANALARRLIERYPNEEQIAVFMNQGYAHIIHLLAIMKAGRVYVPVNTRVPAAKIDLILKQYDCRVLLTDFEHLKELERSLIGIQISTHEIPTQEETASNDSSANLSLGISPKNPAFILSTSGTTGKPKGVVHSHESMIHCLRNYQKAYQLRPEDVHSLLYPVGFLANIRDILVTLLTGASLRHLSVVKSGVDFIGDWIVAVGITILSGPIGVFRRIIGTLPDGFIFENVRVLRMGGDASLKSDFEQFKKHFPKKARFITALASAETGLVRLNALEGDAVLTTDIVPTGHEVDGMNLYLIDDDGDVILDDSVVGRIVVESDYLALGYKNMPELTSEAFKVNMTTGKRYFITNDRGRFEQGCLHFAGRLDFHVKVSGYRVDLNEIRSTALLKHEINDAAVIYHDELNCFYLFYDLTRNSRLESFDLRRFLIDYLPRYMIPSRCIRLDELPLTPNGKIDRHRLYTYIHEFQRDDELAKTETEEKLLKIWCAHFKKESISTADNFFEIGGDSILAYHVLQDVETEFGLSVRDQIIYEHPEIRSLAKAIDENATYESYKWVRKLKSGDGSSPPLFWFLMPQQILFHRISGNQAVYLISGHYSRFSEIPIKQTFDAILGEFSDEVMRISDSGTVVLGGYSIGAVFALEVGRRLSRAGRSVKFVFLLDPNMDIAGNIDSIDEALREEFKKKSRRLRKIYKQKKRTLRLKYCKLLNRAIPYRDRWKYVFAEYRDLKRDLRLEPYDGEVILFCRRTARVDLWKQLIEKGKLQLLVSDHREHAAFGEDEDAIDEWTSALNRALNDR